MEEDLQGLLNKAFFFLKFRPRTVVEMRRYLYKKIIKTHWSRPDTEKVIDHLVEVELLDDKKFVGMFIEDRKNLKPKGRFVLKQELIKHGIDKKLIDDYFEKNSINEESLAEKALLRRWLRFKNLAPEKRFQKASQFLLRRGFEYETVKKTIKKITSEFIHNVY